jgi:hypothetical protein
MGADVDIFSEEELAGGLRAWAAGSYRVEAAVGLLIAHRAWLRRAEFRERAVWVDGLDAGEGDLGDGWFVGIDWDGAAAVLATAPASSSERAILAIAVAIAAGDEHPLDLGEALGRLDAANTTRVLQASAHAAGFHDRHLAVTVTGDLDDVDDVAVSS